MSMAIDDSFVLSKFAVTHAVYLAVEHQKNLLPKIHIS